jgi:hypothetical protein
MYTLEMATAFKSITPPENFKVVILENDDFLTILIDPEDIESLQDEQVEPAVKYINDVKKALENEGAIVFVVRDVLKN